MIRKSFCLIILTLTILMIGTVVGEAKPFYEGKVIKIIVTTKPGGGYDFYGRLVAPYMQKYLPGSTVIVKNVPGGGHLIGTNTIYKAKPDGLTLGTFNRAIGLMQVIGYKGVRFDFKNFSWLGSASTELYSYCVSAKKYQSIDDVMNAQSTRIATSGLGGMNHITAVLFYYMMGKNNYSLGTGYEGGETSMAIMRGEMDGAFGSFDSRKGMVDDGFGRFVMFIGKKKPAGYENVPFIQDVAKEQRFQSVNKFLVGMQEIGRPFAGPPGIPADRLKVLREAFEKAVNDPQCAAFAKKADRPVEFGSVKDTVEWATDIFSLPADVVQVLKKAHGVS